MKTSAQTTFAENAGRILGRIWRICMRLDRRANGWLMAQGFAPGVAKAVLLVVKLIVLGLLLYTAFWLALLLTLALAAARAGRNVDWASDDATQNEWRHGPAGYGLYTFDGHRIDPHDPDDEHD